MQLILMIPMKNKEEAYEKSVEISRNDDHTPGCRLFISSKLL